MQAFRDYRQHSLQQVASVERGYRTVRVNLLLPLPSMLPLLLPLLPPLLPPPPLLPLLLLLALTDALPCAAATTAHWRAAGADP